MSKWLGKCVNKCETECQTAYQSKLGFETVIEMSNLLNK